MKADDHNQTERELGPEKGSSPEEPIAKTAGPITKDSANSVALAVSVNEARPTSSRKAKTNRQNSKHSTGPKTRQGKDSSRRNAIKHGFFSKFLLINGEESRAEYDQWFSAIRDHYQPVNVLEEFWVEQIVVCTWRLRRLLRHERGHIVRALAQHEHGQQLTRMTSQQQGPASEGLETDLIIDHLFLPTNGDLDTTLRYETMINKELNHAMAQLERLQRRRLGESVPAPVSLDILH